MKRFLLILLLGISAPQPILASNIPGIKQYFSFGFVSGAIPIAGQVLGADFFVKSRKNLPISQQIAFIAGHALGMSVWAVPWYLVYRAYCGQVKSIDEKNIA